MYLKIKRTFDFVSALLILIVSAPIQAVAAVAIGATMGRPILFQQERAGLSGRSFNVLKFRTMIPESASAPNLSSAERVTSVGRFLRASSIDELPSMVNVLKGDMSLVGPRPLPVRYLSRYSAEHARRHEVRPGVTGLAQVSGRNMLDWPDRLDLDVRYVDQLSLKLDAFILLRTAMVVIGRRGVTASDSVIMREFRGETDCG